ncbi:MAG: ribonucleoside-diphosphate reductase subunit alpha [Moraxellaceae bacterium]|nr:ribonucleoside-diphosphate reductase subunit alpha [Moraxellaceae bacterium]
MTISAQRSFESSETLATAPGQLRVIKRNGTLVSYDSGKIAFAISKAFLAVEGGSAADSSRVHQQVALLTDAVSNTFKRRMPSGGTVHIEEIQDQVELALMRAGEQKVARSYVIYRDERSKLRDVGIAKTHPTLTVTLGDGTRQPLDLGRLELLVNTACEDLSGVNAQAIIDETLKNLYDGVQESDLATTMVMCARVHIEQEPNYTYVTARLLLDQLRSEALGFLEIADKATQAEMAEFYPQALVAYLKRGIELELLHPDLLSYDLARIADAIEPMRDFQFTYLGLQTLYDRYFIHSQEVRFELPQLFFMRVAMGLAMNEADKEARAIEFYQVLSSFDYMASTPTLFNAGTLRPQLSSCYLTTVPDDLYGIYDAIRDNAMLSKWAGGLGNDWTPVRALGAYIKGTNGKSQGVVPFLKVANDTAVAVNQCFAPDTFVWTEKGCKAIQDIQVGDLVLGKAGYYRPVVKHMVYNQTEPMVEIKARHSAQTLKVTDGHPIWSISIKNRNHTPKQVLEMLNKDELQVKYCEAGKLKVGDFIAQTIPQEVIPVQGFTEDDARFYGIMLGDGHITKGDAEWGVSGNPSSDTFMVFIEEYLQKHSIHYWISKRDETYQQIKWSLGKGLLRCATTGQFVGGNNQPLPFTKEDFYNSNNEKYIAPRFLHLPKSQTKALVRGLLESDGSVSGGLLLNFSNTSHALIEGMRYLLLRLGIPSSASYRERDNQHEGTRADGSKIKFSGLTKSYDLRIPSVPDFAEYFNYRVAKKQFWFESKGSLFTRIQDIKPITPVPFVFDLKVEGDHSYNTVVGAVSNGGKRKGAVCAYLETWHLDIEEFLELRKNTGDDRRRTHDMNTANWVPDLFMQRVFDDGDWMLFSPSDVPDLHDLYGKEFAVRYNEYEQMAANGQMRLFKKIKAQDLWRKMLSMLFETGHPWVTFKDVCNLRSPQQHVGVVHSSNLCTEITLNTSQDEIAVCNLGSINLVNHVTANGLDVAKLEKTVKTAVRMLDNVIDINYYAVPQAKNSNFRHRPVGLGIMGFQDALYILNTAYSSDAAIKFADESMEVISYFAITASSQLAKERGSYSTFEGSLWSQGILPIDSLQKVLDSRGERYIQVDTSQTLDWASLRATVQAQGMRNSNVMAIAPTATISNICGVAQSIEPTYQNLYVKSNLSGEFTVVNPYLVNALKARGLWDSVMVNDLKYYDGSVQNIERIPDDLKALFATAFEVEPKWIVEAASRRQKWIDQAQSLNLYIGHASGKKLDITYRMAWFRGLKTTYYLRAIGATAAEKSTISDGALNAVKSVRQEEPVADFAQAAPVPLACSIDNPDCEACQ